jgi:hypothetical protein
MKENYTHLYPNEQVAIAVGNYAFEHSTKLPEHTLNHHAWSTENSEMADMMISPFQAQFQTWFAKREVGGASHCSWNIGHLAVTMLSTSFLGGSPRSVRYMGVISINQCCPRGVRHGYGFSMIDFSNSKEMPFASYAPSHSTFLSIRQLIL